MKKYLNRNVGRAFCSANQHATTLGTWLAWGALVCCNVSWATVYPLREDGANIFGEVTETSTQYEDTLIDLARSYSLGYEELMRVNPGVDPWLPGDGTRILIPGKRLLPAGPRTGIVVNLPEHRLYYFPPVKRGEAPVVHTFPVSIGKMDWQTPIGTTRVVGKQRNPNWYPPESVRKEHAERGDPLPKVVKPGPDNPLGAYSLRLGIASGSYLIHGTNNPAAVGMAVTHGCIRMYPEDIERLFGMIRVGTPVTLINEPVKIAFVDGELWLEVHPPVDAMGQSFEPDVDQFSERLTEILGDSVTAIHWDLALDALRKAEGIPVVVGIEADLSDPPAQDNHATVDADIAR
ncbi:MAG: L,D-transpeptidase family protein [Steroidobacteraceae bacterium]